MAAFLDSSQLDFASYKQALKDYLMAQSQFQDFDFSGSNVNVLLDLLARNTYHNGFYINMIGSEAFLDTAQTREAIVSKSKELNYLPRSRSSSKALVDITITAPDNPLIITIPKFYSISSGVSSNNYIFSTDAPIVVRANAGIYTAKSVEVFEGRVVTEYFVANTASRYVISSANVDITSLDVNVQNSLTDTANTTWDRAYNLYGLDANSEVYFVQGAYDNYYEIVFGNDITGRAVQNGNVVKVTYRDSLGVDGDGLSRFKPIGNIDGYPNITITLSDGVSSYGGAEREDNGSIKFNAPRYFAAQERAVTKDDYLALIRAEFPQIQSIAVFGGEELDQKRYGKVVISVKPYGSEKAPASLTNIIATYLSTRCPVSVDPIFQTPEYFYIEVNSTVYYNPLVTTKSDSELQSAALSSIGAFSNTYLYDFASDLRYSRLVAAIDGADAAIVSNDTAVRTIKRIAPLRYIADSQYFSFNNRLKRFPDQPSLVSSFFYYKPDGSDTIYQAYIEDDRAGNLYIYTIDNTGTKITLVASIGTLDYTNGTVKINNVVYQDYVGYISFYASLYFKDFTVSRNQIILIDPSDVTINVAQAMY